MTSCTTAPRTPSLIQTLSLAPTRFCRSCKQIVPTSHSLHDCLKAERKTAQYKLDKQLAIDEFVQRNHLIKRTPNDPCASCPNLFGQTHRRGDCSAIRKQEDRDVTTHNLFKDIRTKLGLNYVLITGIAEPRHRLGFKTPMLTSEFRAKQLNHNRSTNQPIPRARKPKIAPISRLYKW